MFRDRPNREFQAGLNAQDSRRQRQKNSLSLRRKDRELALQKKRQRILENTGSPTGSTTSTNNFNDTESQHTQSSQSTSNGGLQISAANLSKFVNGVYTNNPATQYECVKQFRMLLSQERNPPIQQVIDAGVVPRIIQLARSNEYPQLQYESLWVLLNIASGPAECTAHIIRNGSHVVFIDLLRSPLYEIQEQAMWALGNIAGDGVELKDLLLNNNVLPNMVPICAEPFDEKHVTNFNDTNLIKQQPIQQWYNLMNTTSWALSNLCRSTPPPPQHMQLLVDSLCVLLKQALTIPDQEHNRRSEIVLNAVWGLSYMTSFDDCHTKVVSRLYEEGIIHKFVQLMDHQDNKIRHPICRLIGNILTGADENTKLLLQLGILSKYHSILSTMAQPKEKKEICWALSNIAAGPIDDKLAMLDSKLFPILVDFLVSAPFETAKEAAWALSNATADQDKRVIHPLVEFQIIKNLCLFLQKIMQNQKKNNTKIFIVLLECIENVLAVGQQHMCRGETNRFGVQFEEFGGVQYLEQMQADDNITDSVYDKCVEIVKKFFDGEEDSGNGAPEQGPPGLDYNFGLNANPNSGDGTFAFGTSTAQNNNSGSTFGF